MTYTKHIIEPCFMHICLGDNNMFERIGWFTQPVNIV